MSERQARTFLTNATVVDGDSIEVHQQFTVIIEDECIVWVGPSAEAEAPGAADTEIDLTGKTLLPGFMDAHVHLSSTGGLNPASTLHEPETMGIYRGVWNLGVTLDAGVTMVRDLAGTDYSAVLAVQQGLVRGPNIVTAVSAVGPTAGHSDFRTLSVPFGYHAGRDGVLPNIADDVTEAKRVSRELIRVGAGVIKVMATGGVWSPRDAPEHVGLGIDEMHAIVQEANNRGIYVAAHAQGAEGIKNALRAGIKSIEHGYLIDDEGIELMLEKDAWLVPTLTTGTTPPDPKKATPYAVEKKNRVRAQLQENVSKAFAAGVKVALGTDCGVVPHGQNLREIGLMVDLGLDPMTAIQAGTSSAARLLGVHETRGVIRQGMIADLAVTSINPITNPHGLGDPANITHVFQAGKQVK
ncbi:metal-dependent hydrolase family protein [Leucobacter chinensis]|uniref:metal-dependent hydrolase family protein n=1 Tax=Leucobacter chinensis TaxID=2851010 RepID=UPI001C216536|nr:amidohydrolase family protein [Leucobacter chinensis]